jgi:hypothetical protein
MDIIDPRVPPDLMPPGSRAFIINGPKHEYNDLPAVVTPQGRVVSRWSPTEAERARILAGEDLYLTICTFGQRLQPVLLTVGTIDWALAESLPLADDGTPP